jgi:LuxR family maltose regulon positive regulatory protein
MVLHPRQSQVLRLLAQGLTYRQIGDEMGIARTTVVSHVNALRDVLDARNVTHLLARAREVGLLDDGRCAA